MAADEILVRLRAICLALPETKETFTWEHPNFRVGEKIFCLYGGAEGSPRSIEVKTGKEIQGVFLQDPRFFKPPYIGHNGWVGLHCDAAPINWDEVEELVKQSYRLIAPKKLAKLVA